MLVAVCLAILSSIAGLLLSYHQSLPTSPSIILIAGAFYLASIALGRHGSLAHSLWHMVHAPRFR